MADRELRSLSRLELAHAFQGNAAKRKWTFANDDGKHPSKAMDICKLYAEKVGELNFGLLLFGVPDAGKTYMATCIANAAIDKGMLTVCRSMPEVVANAQDTEEMGLLRSAKLLVLDDLGAERDTGYGREIVYALIDYRYGRKKPTIFTTNLSRDELAKPSTVQAARIYNRVLEMCYPVEVVTGRKRSTRERYDEYEKELGL